MSPLVAVQAPLKEPDILREKRKLYALQQEKLRRMSRTRFYRMYPPEGRYAYDQYPKHIDTFNMSKVKPFRLVMAGNGTGKALLNGTPVATPNGWVPIESLKPGDVVLAGDGTPTRVTGVYPQGIKPLLKFTFDGGQTITCCREHLWKVKNPAGRWAGRDWEVVQAGDITTSESPKQRPIVPQGGAWELQEQPVAIDPYLLGLLLGDGGMTAGLSFSTVDEELAQSVRDALPDDVSLVKADRCNYRIASNVKNDRSRNTVIKTLQRMGLHGKGSHDKFVPEQYLINSTATRLAVLRGLMDTDGSVCASNLNVEFSSTSKALADAVVFLVESLGGRAKIKERVTHYTYKGEKRAGRASYRVSIKSPVCPFKLQRKAGLWTKRGAMKPERVIHKIEPAGEGEATCIAVDHSDRTFITEHGIVTHNTFGIGCFETVAHATGDYPDWWEGKRYAEATVILIAGTTTKTTRDIIQAKLIGLKGHEGTGMMPGDSIAHTAYSAHETLDYALIRHKSGGLSRLLFRSFEMGREAFEGIEADFIWLDEACSLAIYGECIQRFRTRDPSMLLTFTPQNGIDELVQLFCPQYNDKYDEAEYEISGRTFINITQDEVPHLTKEEIERGYANGGHMRDAKRYGIPTAGVGKVYPVDESSYVIAPLPRIPRHWRRGYGMDVGIRVTAAIFGAQDAETGVLTVYSEHYQADALPAVHAIGIKARGVWIPGFVDPSARNRNPEDGKKLVESYRKLGLRLKLANNAVEMGIQEILEMMQSGRLKIYNTCTNLLREIRMYSRDEKNKIIKANDHACDGLRYLINMIKLLETPHAEEPDRQMHEETFGIYN